MCVSYTHESGNRYDTTDNTRCKRIGTDGHQCDNRAPWQTRDCGEHGTPTTKVATTSRKTASRAKTSTARRPAPARGYKVGRRWNDDPNGNRRASARTDDDAAQMGRIN